MKNKTVVKSALLLLGSRKTNKRIALFERSIRQNGFATRLTCFPRGAWDLSPFEDEVPSDLGFIFADYGAPRHSNPDVVICFHWIMLPIAVLMRLFGAFVIYDEHDDYELNSREGGRITRYVVPYFVRVVHFFLLPFVNIITCVHLKDSYLKNMLGRLNRNVIELHNYPNEKWKMEPSTPTPHGSLCVVYVGGVWAVKGCDLVALACANAEKLGASVEYHLFGSGDVHLIEKLKLLPNVVIHNQTAPQDIISFLHTHRCIGMVLYQDTARYRLIGTNSHKLYEYVVAGVPVIASNLGEMPEFVRNGVGLVLQSPNDLGGLTEMLVGLAGDQSEWATMHDACLRLVAEQEISWTNEWRKVSNLLLENGIIK